MSAPKRRLTQADLQTIEQAFKEAIRSFHRAVTEAMAWFEQETNKAWREAHRPRSEDPEGSEPTEER